MAKQSFKAQVDRMVVNTEKKMLLVMQQSIQDVVNQAQTPVADGGKMRVDTGFLRRTGQSSLNGMPTGPSVRPPVTEGETFDWDEHQTTATIGRLRFGSTFFFGWTANYAKYRESYDGFLGSALQNWQQIVNRKVEEVRRRFG